MRTMSLLVAVALLAAVFNPGGAQDAKDDAKKLQGAWALTELIVRGVKAPDEDLQGTRFIFEGNKLTVVQSSADGEVLAKTTFAFALDPARKPAIVDLTALDGDFKGTVSPGIYELKGDTLRWCQSNDEKNKDRPNAFVSPEKSRICVFTFKRAK